jgi:hypothetical protein
VTKTKRVLLIKNEIKKKSQKRNEGTVAALGIF